MKILLVMPHVRKKLILPLFIYPSYSLQQVAGATPQKHTVKIVDERYQNINFNEDCDIVGIYCLTYLSGRAYEIGDEFRRRGKTVVIGGDHPSALPNEAKEHADSVVIGEAEATWTQLLSDFENNKLKPFYEQTEPVDPKLIPPANRDVGSNHPAVAAIEASRGCPVGCEFCLVSHRIGGRYYRPRPIENIIDEIKTIKQKYLYFMNPSSTIDPKFTKELFRAMRGLNKTFTCFGNVNVLGKDDELLKLASEAGCKYWNVGFESVSQETINQIGKKTNKVEEYKKTVRNIHDYGMRILGNFIYGFDTDTPDVFDKTIARAHDLDIDIAQFSILTPFPGTPLFKRLEKEGRILTRDWTRYTETDVVFQPKNLTVEQLVEGGMKSYEEFYSMKNIFRRYFRNAKTFNHADLIVTWKMKYLDYNVYYKGKGLKKKDLRTKYKNVHSR